MPNITRFTNAQAGKDSCVSYVGARKEIKAGKKCSHWIWYIFPQLKTLGSSQSSQSFAIVDFTEACEYLCNETLFTNYHEIIQLVRDQLLKDIPINTLMGGELDAKKLVSSITLFRDAASFLAQREKNSYDYSTIINCCNEIFVKIEKQGYFPCSITLNLIELSKSLETKQPEESPPTKPTTKAAKDFIQRTSEYKADEDGRLFQSWYEIGDVERLILPRFLALDSQITKEIMNPYIFFDGIESFTLQDMLAPLVSELEKDLDKKYFPFIFKPELGSAHFVAGFLRKNNNKNQPISIILFNPTGTILRIGYGGYRYHLQLTPEEDINDIKIEDRSDIYLEISDGLLKYTLINSDAKQIINSFTQTDLQEIGINIDLQLPLTNKVLNEELRPKLTQFLKKTLQRRETKGDIEIIPSLHKIQTINKDEGKLSSCGPISVEFIIYAIEHPEYMAKLDKNFLLPPYLEKLLKSDNSQYKAQIIEWRQQHYTYLQEKVQDELLEQINESQIQMTAAILQKDEYEELDEYEEYEEYSFSSPAATPFSLGESDINTKSAKDNEEATNTSSKDSDALKKNPDTFNTTHQDKPEDRIDIQFIKKQIQRYRDNAKSLFSINNKNKADALESALNNALKNKIIDVRLDSGVKAALEIHRIFSFFGYKKTKAIEDLEASLKLSK